MTNVREATFDVLRQLSMTRIFSNPGSTEVSLLTDLPDDLEFVLGLHEASVVGMATGHALASGTTALAILHTTAGLGNAVGALATARVNKAPLVVVVGQQDRRHLALEPFLAGHLDGLAGDYPVWVNQPARPQDVPGSIARAYYEAEHARGPAIVIVPMDDWLEDFDTTVEQASPTAVVRSRAVAEQDLAAVVEFVEASLRPLLVVGAGLDTREGWDGVIALAERLGCDVQQESFGSRAGFPQDHQQFRGHLPAGRARLRETLSAYDLVLTIGAPVFRQYPFESGRLAPESVPIVVITDDPAEAHRSPATLAVLADPAHATSLLSRLVGPRKAQTIDTPSHPVEPLTRPMDGAPLRAVHVLQSLASRLSAESVVVEETPSSRPDLHRLIPARAPLGFLSAAMGGLGFAMPASIGVKMASPSRPVITVIGDGSSLYSIQALWSAARYNVGVLFVVLSNGRYAIMDRLAEQEKSGPAPWPSFEDVSIGGIAESLGCPVTRVSDFSALTSALDEVVPTLETRKTPLVLEVAVATERTFQA
ncbi:Benzoylformate decarboxylase [Rhodococcus sp. B7740]|uniref:thiamine pyrophosphate-dependent enzyme n=1 Tax=Rhodococcus sp. B7740 TaxID=1564114 RepID=UPI0005D89057|nr:Benzoylformate decarboxylase [Rhodococcus sp. B7740]